MKPFDHLQSDRLFNWTQFESAADQYAAEFANAKPYPWIAIDGLFNPEFLREMVSEFPPLDSSIWMKYNDPEIQIKLRSNWKTEADISPAVLQAVQILNSGRFLRVLNKISGIPGMIADAYYTGGGLNQIVRGGELAVHIDGNRHDLMGVHRRSNAILYLNENWKAEYHGELEFWNVEKTRCETKVAPLFNRLAIFNTNDFTPHGHPTPLNCPEGMSRKSLIHYYYTSDRPAHETKAPGMHRAEFTKSRDLPKGNP